MKKIKIIQINLLILVFAAVGFTGCKKFLDTNDNPNLVTSTTPELSLPSAQAAIGHALGNPFQIYGGIWGQFWTQNTKSSQYRSLERYNAVTTTDYDRPWRMIYSDALQDLQEIFIYYQTHPTYKQYAAIAYLMRAYAFQMATDAWGDIPLGEALNTEIPSPHYTPQEQVYDTIIAHINTAISMIDVDAALTPKSDDLIFGGDMEQWMRFANTFKLRALLRLSEVAPQKAQAGIATLNGADFLEEDAQINYSTTGGNQNPLFSEILALGRTQNLIASETAAKYMTDNQDPRASVFYEPITVNNVDTVIGLVQGNYTSNTSTFSIPAPIVGAKGSDDNSSNAPVKFMSAAESYFLQAEAVVRGWLTGSAPAQELFENGIRASFESYDVEGVENYITTAPAAQWPAGQTAQIRAVIIQKWLAMNGNQNFEAWTEWRRTGYPDFFTVSVNSKLSGGRMPERFLYPSSEVTSNLSFPGVKQVSERVWWDVN